MGGGGTEVDDVFQRVSQEDGAGSCHETGGLDSGEATSCKAVVLL